MGQSQVLCGWCGHPVRSLSHYYHEQKMENRTRASFFLFLCAVTVWLGHVFLPKLHLISQAIMTHLKIYWPVYAFEGIFALLWTNMLVLGCIMGVI